MKAADERKHSSGVVYDDVQPPEFSMKIEGPGGFRFQ
jgi:hypothetical protein